MNDADPMLQWFTAAGVRSGVRRTFHDETDLGKVFFPRSLVPHLAHPLVRALPAHEINALTLRHLYQFLMSTTHVETRVVNVGAELIANGRCGVDLPMASRIDALKVYTDEGYHALYSIDLANQIAAATGVPVPDWDYGSFVERLRVQAEQLLPHEPIVGHLMQVVVFETLITAVLNELPADTSVVGTIRDVMRDHARDEGRHHRYFSGFFHELWGQLDRPIRQRAGLVMPRLIKVCLTADTVPVSASLHMSGLADEAVVEIVSDTYGEANAERIAQITRGTVNMCASAGVFDEPGVLEQFAEHGMQPR